MGTLDVAVFFVLAYTPSYLLLRTREGREWVIVACAIGWLLATLVSFVVTLAVDSALGVSITLLANRTQAELSYGFLGGVLGIWQGARFAMLKRTGAIAKNKWLNWLALLLLVVLPVRFGEFKSRERCRLSSRFHPRHCYGCVSLRGSGSYTPRHSGATGIVIPSILRSSRQSAPRAVTFSRQILLHLTS